MAIIQFTTPVLTLKGILNVSLVLHPQKIRSLAGISQRETARHTKEKKPLGQDVSYIHI